MVCQSEMVWNIECLFAAAVVFKLLVYSFKHGVIIVNIKFIHMNSLFTNQKYVVFF
jgi:hypothetical protein